MATKTLSSALATAGRNPRLPARLKDPVAEADIVAITGAGTVFVTIGRKVVEAQPLNDGLLRAGRQGWITQRDDGAVVIHGRKN